MAACVRPVLAKSLQHNRQLLAGLRSRAIFTRTQLYCASESRPASKENEQWQIKMLYDGECPLCLREVNMLVERNMSYKSIKFVDISASDYSSELNSGIGYAQAMGKIHAISRDGQILTNVEAFRKLYEAVGLGWVYAVTKYQPFASIANVLYSVWAKFRLPLTGRPSLGEILEKKSKP